MIFDLKARGGGYFRVYVRQGELLSEHTAEREASQQCVNAYLADPACKPYYQHEGPTAGSPYVVDLTVTDSTGSIVVPAPTPTPTSTQSVTNILDKMAEMAPPSTYTINAPTFEAGLPLFAARHTDWLAHALTYEAGGKKRLGATTWKGIVIVWKWAQIDLLARPRST